MDEQTKQRILARASRSKIARELGINLSAVSRWFKAGRIPAERVPAVSELTGVPRKAIRPDIYGRFE